MFKESCFYKFAENFILAICITFTRYAQNDRLTSEYPCRYFYLSFYLDGIIWNPLSKELVIYLLTILQYSFIE